MREIVTGQVMLWAKALFYGAFSTGMMAAVTQLPMLSAEAMDAPHSFLAQTPGDQTGLIHQHQKNSSVDAIVPQQNEQDSVDTAPVDQPLRFKVERIVVEGAANLQCAEAEGILASYEGRELSFKDLNNLAEELTACYQKAGHLTSAVYVPPQKIKDGTVYLKAAEGRIGKITYTDGRWIAKRAILPRFAPDEGDVFEISDLKRSLRRINENQDVQVKASLVPGDNPEETDINLTGEGHFPIHVTPFWDNMGRQTIGNKRMGLTINHNNVLGLGDQNLTALSFSVRSFGLLNRYEVPIGAHGTKVGFDFGYSQLTLGNEFKDLDVKGKAFTYSPYISQELYNSDRTKISTDIAFDIKNITTHLLGVKFNDDRIRVIRPGLNIDFADRYGRTLMRHELGLGVDWFRGTDGWGPNASRKGAGTQFFRYTGSITRFQRMPWNTYGVFRAATQLTNDRLISAEQYQLGGAFTVRGYREGIVIGDNGFLFSGEWRVPAFIFPKKMKIPFTKKSTFRDNIQFVAFSEMGSVFTNDAVPGVDSSETLYSVWV